VNEQDRFWAKVDVGHPLGCWEWTAATNGNGYGKFVAGSRTNGTRRYVLAHRYAYETVKGDLTSDEVLDHLCLTRGCVNPDHLEVTTNRGNLLRSHRTVSGKASRVRLCPSGHPYAGRNLYLTSEGHRQCRTCRTARDRSRSGV
jgi:hypothetical protein